MIHSNMTYLQFGTEARLIPHSRKANEWLAAEFAKPQHQADLSTDEDARHPCPHIPGGVHCGGRLTP